LNPIPAMTSPPARLTAIKLLHTAIWAGMVTCIVGAPVAAMRDRLDWAAALSAPVLIECVILALNRRKCPLTDVAARYTASQAANFDIYLPEPVARYNKIIFGTLFLLGEVIVVWRWLM
jgi:hypothetical protein